jgi:peptidoglycan/LPS O-acetylase OafA/YrhL
MGHPVRAILTIFNFWSGVDLFLAISGFVIAELNYRFVETPRRRRGVRIPDRIRRGDRGAHIGDAAREAA